MKKGLYPSILVILLSIFSSTFSLGQSRITVFAEDSVSLMSYAHVKFTCLTCNTGKTTAFILTNDRGIATNPFDASTQIHIKLLGYKDLIDTLAQGQSQKYYLQQSSVTLNEVVITAQYSSNNPEKAVHKVKIVDRKRIEAQGAVTLRDVLTNETNIRISQDNVLGSSTSIQGLSGQNVKILIDGVPVIGRLGGNIDLSQINLNNIERIEIIEGPLSVEYGTNALAGTINLNTKKKSKYNYDLGLNTYYETVGQYNIDGQVSWHKGKNSIVMTGGRNYFDGWSTTDKFIDFSTSNIADTNRVSEWNPKEQYFGQLQYIREISNLKLRYASSYFEETITNKGLPRKPFYETAFDDYYYTQRFDNTLSLNGKVGKNGNLNMIFSYNDYKRRKNTFYKNLITLEELLTEAPSDQDTTLYNLIMARGSYSTSNDSSKFNYSVGYDINVETGIGQRIKNNEQQIGDYAIFGSAEYCPIKEITIRPGVRYSHNTSYPAPLTPSLNIRYKFSKSYTLRASYSRGFRAPSIKDLYFNFVDINHDIQGNPNLEAETSDNYAVSTTWQRVNRGKIYKANFSLFYNDISDLITLAIGEGTSYSYFNLEQYKTLGTQLNMEFSIEHFKVSIGGSYTGVYNSLSSTEGGGGKPYNYSPEVRSSALYNFRKWNLQVAGFYKYTGSVVGYYLDDEDAVQQSFLDDFHTLDFTITKGFWKNKIKWTIGGKNLLGVQNIQSTGATGVHSSNTGVVAMSWGRSIFTALKINLNDEVFTKKKTHDK
ncbi:MAG: TonB-dependent receptor [Cytophagales bacterium]|nr:TonB-dependent receptor [Cytophagales bacterium]